jgi:hypothetical protein
MNGAPIIETMLAGYESDGTPLYMTEREAGLLTAARGLNWVIDHPQESLRGLGVAAVAGLCGFLLYDALPKPKPERKPASARKTRR